MTDFDHFQKNLPETLIGLLDRINSLGFKAYLIGGIPRDYLMKKEVGHDFDFELRPFEEGDLQGKFKNLVSTLRNDGLKLREMGMSIFEINFEGHSVELGLPRVEEFTDEVHHSNFTAHHIADLDFSKGFKRRDFTINAIAFEYFKTWRVVDPLGGVGDIQNKLLRACDPASFVKDPVRFLRAIRFWTKLDLVLDPLLRTLLENMPLKISSHYLKLEAKKSTMPLLFFLEAADLRSEVFGYKELLKEEESVKEYSYLFRGEELKKHIEEAFFLSSNIRKKLLDEMGMSSKGVMEFPLKEMNISRARALSAEELKNSSWAKGAIKFFSIARELGRKKVDWLMQEAGSPYDFSFIEEYQDLELERPEGLPNELISFAIFKSKIEKIAK